MVNKIVFNVQELNFCKMPLIIAWICWTLEFDKIFFFVFNLNIYYIFLTNETSTHDCPMETRLPITHNRFFGKNVKGIYKIINVIFLFGDTLRHISPVSVCKDKQFSN